MRIVYIWYAEFVTVRHGRAMFSTILLLVRVYAERTRVSGERAEMIRDKSKEKIKATVSSCECFIFDTRTV